MTAKKPWTWARFVATGLASVGGALGLLILLGPRLSLPFARFLVMVAVTKLAGDLVYFLVSPSYREVIHIDDYLANDFLTFFRFGLPLAVIQALALSKDVIPMAYQALWNSPAVAAALYLVNRWLIEKAYDKRSRERGGVPVVGRSHAR